MSSEGNELLKLQYGRVYIQVPNENKEAIQFMIDFLNHCIKSSSFKKAVLGGDGKEKARA